MTRIGSTDLDVFALGLGGNVFGWTSDETQSVAVLDAYAEAGGNFIDTADVYSAWAPGNSGGESETIVGRWMSARGNRNRIVLATKVGMAPGLEGLSAKTIRAAVEASLARLQTDHIDLYYAHKDDPLTPLEETLRAFDALVREGKVRYIAASQYGVSRLSEALETSRRAGLARYVAMQAQYSLVHRSEYEGELQTLCVREGISCVPYYALANGFLTGKYRLGTSPEVSSARADRARRFLNEHGLRVLDALDAVATRRATTIAAVALAWTASQPGVAIPLASARTPEQLVALLPVATLHLGPDDLSELALAAG